MLAVHPAQIAGFQKSVGREHFRSFFGHVVIALHDHRTFHSDFADSVFVRAKNLDFLIRRKIHSDAFDFKMFERIQRDDWRSFGETVALNEIDSKRIVGFENARRERAASANRDAHRGKMRRFQN